MILIKVSNLPMLLLVLLLSCKSYIEELQIINDTAESLHTEIAEILRDAMKQAGDISILAIDQAFDFQTDPWIQRVIAKTAAKTLAEEAVRVILREEAQKLDTIFGVQRFSEVSGMIFNTYLVPAVSDIITSLIEKKLRGIDPSLASALPPKDINSIIESHFNRLELKDVVDFVKGLATENLFPEFFDTLNILPVNTATYASTRNWKDNGLLYQYRITGNSVEIKRSDEPWQELQLPETLTPRILAADNNRLFVLTEDNQLWWYCVKRDQAQWSIDIMNTAVEVMSLKPLVADTLADVIVPYLTAVTDTVACRVGKNPLFEGWQDLCDGGSKIFWNSACSTWINIGLSIDRLLLKSGGGESFTAEAYAEWSKKAHREGAWTNLTKWSVGEETFIRGENVDPREIQDIAVGNWNGTVVTMYILAKGEIWYIDEEIIHPEWKAIKQWNKKWSIFAKDYEDIGNSPFPLGRDCRIDASNSVISVTKPYPDSSEFYWIRCDYHQKDDFIYWPLDWCEHAWYRVAYPSDSVTEFSINTMGIIDPREDNTVWSIPAPAFTFHNYLPQTGYKGIFGDIQRDDVSTYPIEISAKDKSGKTQRFFLSQAEKRKYSAIEWKKY